MVTNVPIKAELMKRHKDPTTFGEETTGHTDMPMRFTGFEHDLESNLDHTWFRKYSSTQDRWLSPDPLGGSASNPQSLNRYAYVMNIPLNLVDLDGLCPRANQRGRPCSDRGGSGGNGPGSTGLLGNGDRFRWPFRPASGWTTLGLLDFFFNGPGATQGSRLVLRGGVWFPVLDSRTCATVNGVTECTYWFTKILIPVFGRISPGTNALSSLTNVFRTGAQGQIARDRFLNETMPNILGKTPILCGGGAFGYGAVSGGSDEGLNGEAGRIFYADQLEGNGWGTIVEGGYGNNGVGRIWWDDGHATTMVYGGTPTLGLFANTDANFGVYVNLHAPKDIPIINRLSGAFGAYGTFRAAANCMQLSTKPE